MENLKNFFLEFINARILASNGIPYYLGQSAESNETSMVSLMAFASLGMENEAIPQKILKRVINNLNSNGSIGVFPSASEDGLWLTAHAILVGELYQRKPDFEKSLEFLLNRKSVTFPNYPEVTQDNSLVGWPWVTGTFGWVEPTAWSLLALKKAGKGNDERWQSGKKFLLDRMVSSGGWNCGNKMVYGNELLPFLDITSLCLMALDGIELNLIQKSIDFVKSNSLDTTSLYATSLAKMALDSLNYSTDDLGKYILEKLNGSEIGAANISHISYAVMSLGKKRMFLS
ncbi:MAG: terpene cyclase/mutase family protein [Candidatus Riflebacteria bacterium]|nr:terpene cyclase/mutase family protein [Candidatus Riflebacteria bacterium]